jgi:hypothetical protein
MSVMARSASVIIDPYTASDIALSACVPLDEPGLQPGMARVHVPGVRGIRSHRPQACRETGGRRRLLFAGVGVDGHSQETLSRR